MTSAAVPPTAVLPTEVRREWAGRLAEAGCLDEARQLLPDDDPGALVPRAFLALVGGRPDRARELLAATDGQDGLLPLLRDAAEAAAGEAHALPRVMSRAATRR